MYHICIYNIFFFFFALRTIFFIFYVYAYWYSFLFSIGNYYKYFIIYYIMCLLDYIKLSMCLLTNKVYSECPYDPFSCKLLQPEEAY